MVCCGQRQQVLRSTFAAPYTGAVSTVEHPEPPAVRVYAPDEAVKHARPLPPRERLVITDVPDDEWKAFQEALAEA